ncbi:hypothetical protein RRG08_045635 [Elysia crispata]|uniref:Uncharacterized protein n=1 Tax=Elysia crispata TaxID=231223 RepID=A0AAE0XYM0_9GAST|nr:hypothetical protein RRG08_045635 [Elysia crispata]
MTPRVPTFSSFQTPLLESRAVLSSVFSKGSSPVSNYDLLSLSLCDTPGEFPRSPSFSDSRVLSYPSVTPREFPQSPSFSNLVLSYPSVTPPEFPQSSSFSNLVLSYPSVTTRVLTVSKLLESRAVLSLCDTPRVPIL